jgi:hypothetical protein
MSKITDTPLTDLMIETLMDCHERELTNLESYDAALTPSAGDSDKNQKHFVTRH